LQNIVLILFPFPLSHFRRNMVDITQVVDYHLQKVNWEIHRLQHSFHDFGAFLAFDTSLHFRVLQTYSVKEKLILKQQNSKLRVKISYSLIMMREIKFHSWGFIMTLWDKSSKVSTNLCTCTPRSSQWILKISDSSETLQRQ